MLEVTPFYPREVPLPDGLEISDRGEFTRCPHCTQGVQLRTMSLGSTLVNLLRILVACPPGTNSDEYLGILTEKFGHTAARAYTNLQYWQFLDKVRIDGEIKWVITREAREFVEGRLCVPQTMWVFENAARIRPDHDQSPEMIMINSTPRRRTPKRKEVLEDSHGLI